MNARLTHRFSRGLYTQFYYRYSKSIDESSWEGPCACTNETYPQNLKSERGPSDFDATHYFTAAAVYELPFLRSRRDLLGRALGGWEIDPIITARSGFPWTPVDGQSVETPAGATLRPGALIEGMMVVASYREENGDKVLTGLAVKDRGRAPATPGDSPRRY